MAVAIGMNWKADVSRLEAEIDLFYQSIRPKPGETLLEGGAKLTFIENFLRWKQGFTEWSATVWRDGFLKQDPDRLEEWIQQFRTIAEKGAQVFAIEREDPYKGHKPPGVPLNRGLGWTEIILGGAALWIGFKLFGDKGR